MASVNLEKVGGMPFRARKGVVERVKETVRTLLVVVVLLGVVGVEAGSVGVSSGLVCGCLRCQSVS